ncbi:transcriptional regulator, GntR family [Pelagibacterium luteolum]|uniref:Transcriptional regulator, GntR family n=1 Tax=Pelagibacterium luteolum TaxID=440168 RepID=A0A1G7WW49_9HYPH|nr:transcriptional regulator, GntR family [Pelagibacterium luteolum]
MFDDRSPIYRQIADRIKADVANGTLSPDEQVMSTNQYASFYAINPATAAKAFAQLVDEGVLYKRRGVGMFVSPGAREALVSDKRTKYFDAVLGPALDEAEAIGIDPKDIFEFLAARTKRDPK